MTEQHDASARFVLRPDAPWLANLAALWTADPALAAKVEALDDDTAYTVEPSRSGPPTMAVTVDGGRRLYLHSRHDPVAEAAKLVSAIDVNRQSAFFLFGLGLGYALQTLFDRAGEESLFFIFEPDLQLLRSVLGARDISRIISSKRVSVLCQFDKADLLTRLTPHTAQLSLGVETVVHPVSQQLHGDFHRQVNEWIGEFNAFGRTSLNTLVANSRRTAENLAQNIGWYVGAPGIGQLQGRHQGKPAIIVSAGPSLRKNKHLLKELRDRAVIIAVQTTLKPLLEMGVEPHYATSLDYHEICTRFFEKLPPSLTTELVAEPKAASAILSMYPGPISLLGNDFCDGLTSELKLDRPRLTAGATVAHLAYYLAEHLRCDPIIFIGQDLGFSDGLCYTPGTSYEDVWRPEAGRFCTFEMKQWEQIVRERFILRRIPDYQGRPMYTEERLFTYLQQFERDFMRTKTRIIDATEGGAAKRGATYMTLAEAARQFCASPLVERSENTHADMVEPMKLNALRHPGVNWARLGDTADCLRRRRGEAHEIERISRDTLPLLAEIRDHLDNQARVNRAIGAVDGLRARMNELGACYDLVTQLTQPTELKRFEADRKIAAAKADGMERQRLQVDRDIENVRGIMQAAADFQKLMDDVIDQLASRQTAKAA